jgi:CDGSH-type Zn-finger protein
MLSGHIKFSVAREITHEEEGPLLIDEDDVEEQGGTVAVCQCGLSGNQPYCDGSHAVTSDEEDGKVYRYENDDDEGERTVVSEE